MSYKILIEGARGARRVRRGTLPRRGEWLSVPLERKRYWLPVIEVAYMISDEKFLDPPQGGCQYTHEEAEPLVYCSLALSVQARARSGDEEVKFLLPPSRWCFGGRLADDEGCGDSKGTKLGS